MKKFKLYLIDFDGTLIDSYECLHVFYNHVFGPYGVKLTKEESYKISKISLQHAFEKLVGDNSKIEEFAKRTKEIVASGSLLKYNKYFDDTLAFIDFIIKNNLNCGIVSGNQKEHIEKVLHQLNTPNFYKVSVTSLELTKQKPDPEGIKLALKRFNYTGDLKDVVYIGDSGDDFKAANAAGVTAVLVDRFNDFEPSSEYIKINSLLELI